MLMKCLHKIQPIQVNQLERCRQVKPLRAGGRAVARMVKAITSMQNEFERDKKEKNNDNNNKKAIAYKLLYDS